jgi:NAD(P)-dependent dehydrogenase (short-subunit alcohol dehydrogenase family)
MNDDYFSLAGKRALVVGAEGAIGRAIALAVAEAGADVAVCAGSTASDAAFAVKKVAKEIEGLGRKSVAEAADTSLGTGAQVMVRQVAKGLGGLDVLVNAQSLYLGKPFDQTSDAEWSRVVGSNLSSVFYTCRAAVKEMLKTGGGAIVNLASGLGQRGMANSVAFCAVEGGVITMTRAIAIEYGRRNIRANVLSLGWFEDTPGAGPNDPKENRLLRYIPMRRFGKPEEAGPLAVYLASDSAGYLNGQVYNVDGGVLARL